MINYKCMHKQRVSFITKLRTAPSLHSKPVSIRQCDNCADEDRDKRYFLLKVRIVSRTLNILLKNSLKYGEESFFEWSHCIWISSTNNSKTKKYPKMLFILAHLLDSKAFHTRIFSLFCYNVRNKFSSGWMHVIPTVWKYGVNQNAEKKNVTIFHCNSLKMKCVCFIQRLKAYCAVNPLHFSYN